jgi:signal transduction histidine kinase
VFKGPIPMRAKMIIMLVIPLLAVLFFVQLEIRRSLNSVAETERTFQLLQFTVIFSDMVHELQKERGLSSAYLGSINTARREKFSAKLITQHRLSDTKIAAAESFLTHFDVLEFGTRFPQKLNQAIADLAQIDQKRRIILHREMDYTEALGYYTDTLNGQFLSFIAELVTLSSINQQGEFNAYANFFQSKEFTGIERAIGSYVLARGQFDKGLYEMFTKLINDQATYKRLFFNLADTQQRRMLEATLRDPVFAEVESMRSTLIASQQLANELHDITAYGGLIYNSNNYLQHGSQQFLDAFNEDFYTIGETLAKYRRQESIPKTVLKDLTLLSDAINSYKSALNTAATMRSQGQGTEAIRSTVMISDTPALEAMRRISRETLNIDPVRWFDKQTQKIDALKRVEDWLSSELLTTTDKLASAASSRFVLTLILALLVVGTTLFVAIITMRSIILQVGADPAKIRQIAAQIALGDLDIKTVGGTGILASIHRIVDTLKEATAQARVIASGDFSADITLRGDHDELGKAWRGMTQTLREASLAVEAVADGKFDITVDPKGPQDRLGLSLLRMTTALGDRAWLRNHTLELVETMADTDDIRELSQRTIAYMAKALNAKMASLYLANERGDVLVLHSTYARYKPINPSREIQLGEGITGQAALEKHMISLSNVPEDYPQLSSSLGNTSPRHILAAPLLHEGRLIGVAEFASVDKFSDLQLSLLRQSSENIAVALGSATDRSRLAQLLQQSQSQSEELQSQQEELRASNEELELQSDELKASNEELEEKTEALERQKQEVEKRTEEVEEAKEIVDKKVKELAQANKYKSEFLANMSHELRTPLNSLLILAKMLAGNDEGNLTEEQVESAHIIHSGGQDLLALINEILDLSKIEAGMMEVHNEEVQLTDIASNIQQQFERGATEKELELIISIAPDMPTALITDAQRLEQILRNFMSNAVKFTAEGSVCLHIGCPEESVRLDSSHLTPANTIAFSVRDTGPGIAKDKHDAIFEAFQQADGSTSRQYGGTGLGLSISMALAQLLNGEIQLDSEVGTGSIFTLYLPLERRAHRVEPPPRSAPRSGEQKTRGIPRTPASNVPRRGPGIIGR